MITGTILIEWSLIFKHLWFSDPSGAQAGSQTLPPNSVMQVVTGVHRQDWTLKMLIQHAPVFAVFLFSRNKRGPSFSRPLRILADTFYLKIRPTRHQPQCTVYTAFLKWNGFQRQQALSPEKPVASLPWPWLCFLPPRHFVLKARHRLQSPVVFSTLDFSVSITILAHLENRLSPAQPNQTKSPNRLNTASPWTCCNYLSCLLVFKAGTDWLPQLIDCSRECAEPFVC